MHNLREEQLNYIKPSDFIKQQLVVNGIGLFVWLPGLIYVLFSPKLSQYRFIAFAYILVFVFLLEMNGKEYYLFGAYPVIFAAGGYRFEQLLQPKRVVLRALLLLLTLVNLILSPLVLPFLSLDQTIKIYAALHIAPKWEDQKAHPLSQDYADMLGWDELGDKVPGPTAASAPVSGSIRRSMLTITARRVRCIITGSNTTCLMSPA